MTRMPIVSIAFVAMVAAFVGLLATRLMAEDSAGDEAKKAEAYIDIHFHADARTEDGGDLPRVAKYMEANHVSKCIIMQFRKSLPRNEKQRITLRKNFEKYKGRIYRFGVLFAKDVADKQHVVQKLKQMKSEGVIGFGEHYGRGFYFDDPKNMILYEACAELGLPVLFHTDGKNNKDDKKMSHLENALKSHPKCKFIGHGPGFWGKIKSVDRLMGKYPNLYADISAGSGFRALARDLPYSRDFMIRHSKRVLFGTDGGPWSLNKKQPPPHFGLIDSLNLPAEIKAKVCRFNAMKLFGFK